ncbi:MAG: sugar kinase [Firmicutes bacterium]|nr:sugar kinase [Bacillota bacterium]
MSRTNVQSIEFTKDYLEDILNKIKKLRVGVIGDTCLDVYWEADMTLSELSRETPHFPLPVVNERMSLGGGGNVAANVHDLGTNSTLMLTVIGEDWRGEQLIKLFLEKGISTDNVIISNKVTTPAYCKPIRKGISDIAYEDPRLDFENRIPIGKSIEDKVLNELNEIIDKIDILLVVDQLKNGVVSQAVREKLSNISQKGIPVVVDSRNRISLYLNVIIKPNEVEAVSAVYQRLGLNEINYDVVLNAVFELYKKTAKPVIITMGSKGALWYEGKDIIEVSPYPVEPPIDIVGAGDTFMAAFSCAFGSGIPGPVSVAFGNLASSIVLKKIGTTGTVTPSEIFERLESL